MADPPITRKKVAIIGGGVGGMTAAYELTSGPWADQYDITLYQLGWRLGGKGASGRNRNRYDRIEEHGLHFWFGYYENAFRMIRDVYAELGRLPGQPLANWTDAFKPHSLFILMQFYEANWSQWRLDMPLRPGTTPGDGEIPTLWKLLDDLLEWIEQHLLQHAPEVHAQITATPHPDWMHALAGKLGLDKAAPGALGLKLARDIVARFAQAPQEAKAQGLHEEAGRAVDHFVKQAVDLLGKQLGHAADELASWPPWWRRLVAMVMMGGYTFIGMLVDSVWEPGGFDKLDELDLREWYAKHGAPSIVMDSDALRVAYESIFAFRDGAYESPSLAAGTGLKGLMRLYFTYKEAFAFKMQAGMGDTVFGPMYEVLKRRGVKFQFFSNVTEVVPSDDATKIVEIHIRRQATVKAGPEAYDPLYDVKGLPCWPSEPLYDQLVEGEQLRTQKINLESYWTPWPGVGDQILRLGQDFDEVVLATSLGPVPIVCPKILAQKPAWQQMVDNIEAIGTQAFQVWTTPDSPVPQGPDPAPEQPIFGGFAQPHNTISDMTHLLVRESWPAEAIPGALFYFCGPLSEALQLPPPTEHWFPEQQSDFARVRAEQWLRTSAQILYPQSMYQGYPQSFPDTFRFKDLYNDPKLPPPTPDSLRFNYQYWRANVDPSERYVISAAGSIAYRMKPDDTGYENLTIAGDWTYNGMNVGCVEGAVMSGMAACRTITGQPLPIFGEDYPRVE